MVCGVVALVCGVVALGRRWVGVRVRAMACGGVGYPLGSVASVWSGRADQTKHLNVI